MLNGKDDFFVNTKQSSSLSWKNEINSFSSSSKPESNWYRISINNFLYAFFDDANTRAGCFLFLNIGFELYLEWISGESNFKFHERLFYWGGNNLPTI